MKAWHFSNGDRLGYGDAREIVPGETLTVDGPPALCQHGLHGSVRILDALKYAPGLTIWRCDLGGEIVHGNDKIVASERTPLWGFNTEPVLRKFARMCALDVIDLWDAPDLVVRYLKAGDPSLQPAARAAVWNAAGDAAKDAGSAAARAAAWYAARSAAGDAARSAAWYAAKDAGSAAARAAARSAARDRQNRRLTRMINKEARALGLR